MENFKVLIVEDQSIIAKDIKTILERLGYTICGIAHDTNSALDLAFKTKPDIIIMDIVLNNNESGINTYAKISEKIDIPVIYLTAHTNKDLINKAKNTKPYAYILKPFEEKELDINIQIAIYKHIVNKELEAERLFSNKIINTISQGIIVFSNDLEIIMINNYAKDYINLYKNDLLEKSIKIDDIFLENILDDLVKNNNKNIILNESRFYFKKTNKKIIANSSISSISDNLFILVFQDITDIREAKKNSKFHNRRYIYLHRTRFF
ncbi:MAG: hypothetical protein KatS3mg068_1179 [Candidatus Sericytochromatia bacterium]|nr:MAG: hypothetical protein KatS3mg068_1179 [Candidatus Sericytochromatia bacterium]